MNILTFFLTTYKLSLVRRVPEGTGWILDGFPSNYNQAKILEKALSGFDAAAKEGKGKENKLKQKKSVLAPDPRPPPVPADPASGIDVVILFDVSDELCLKRAAGRTSKRIFFPLCLFLCLISQNSDSEKSLSASNFYFHDSCITIS